MPDVNPKVMSMVEEELRKDPTVSTTDLYEKAVKIDKSIGELAIRQFNGRYPLQVKRRQAPRRQRAAARAAKAPRQARAAAPKPAAAPAPQARRAVAAPQPADRDAVRGVLLDFAKDIAKAENKADVVDAVAGIDRYVNRVMKAAGA